MTDAQKIKLLTTALRDLALSADRYIEDGSWIDHLYNDIQQAKKALKLVRLNKPNQNISKLITGEKNVRNHQDQ